jgi:hypothetical protein
MRASEEISEEEAVPDQTPAVPAASPCSPAHLSNLARGDKGASGQLAALLDRVRDVGGELAVLAESPSREEKRAAPRAQAPGQVPADAPGLSLSLPYVPGRLVIEMSAPDVDTGQTRAEPAGRRAACPSP